MAIVTSERGLGNVLLPHTNLVVPGSQVNLREELRPPQLIHQIINPWNRVHVLHRFLVQGPVVNAHPQCVVLLLHQYY